MTEQTASAGAMVPVAAPSSWSPGVPSEEGAPSSFAADIYFRRRLPGRTKPPPLDLKGVVLDVFI